MQTLPEGTITFLFSDIEGSTGLWEADADAMSAAMIRHDALIESLVQAQRGQIVRPRGEGDSRFAVFDSAPDAVAAAAAIQRALSAEPWPTPRPLKVRIGLHTGEADLRAGDYYGPAVNRCARIRALGAGGQTLVSETTARLVARLPEKTHLHSRGDHRLKDLLQPEHVFELSLEDLPGDFPPLRSLQAHQTNLPIETSSFVGRESELANVKALMQTSRLVTLTGSGGTGKTRLALQAAADLTDHYTDGVWLLELAPLTDPDFVPQAIANLFGLSEESGKPIMSMLLTYFQHKNLLLILDNCEHLILACAQLASAILRGSRGVSLLASSREALGIPGEQSYAVPSLGLPASETDDCDTANESEAVRLFVERARAVNPHFDLAAGNTSPVVQICRRLDGIPLALELAAARVKVLTPEQILTRLDDRFRLLTGGSRTALPRQQTLRNTVEWSYSLLPDAERVLFRRLSVFIGGWTLEAAEAICSDDADLPDMIERPASTASEDAFLSTFDVLDLMTHLIDKSLVAIDETLDGTRYRFLETIRQYAREKLVEADEAERCRDRHLAWYLQQMETRLNLMISLGRREWLAELDVELDNLRAALEWAAEMDDTLVARLMVPLSIYFSQRRHHREGRRWLDHVMSRPEYADGSQNHARLLVGSGALEFGLGHNDLALALFDEALALLRPLSDEAYLVFTLMLKGATLQFTTDPQALIDVADELEQLSRRGGFQVWRSIALETKARALSVRGRAAEARLLLQEAVAVARESGAPEAIPFALLNLAVVEYVEGHYAQAEAYDREAQAAFSALRDRTFIYVSLSFLGDITRRQGDLAQAEANYQQVLRHWQEIGNQGAEASVLLRLGYTAIEQSQLETAQSRFESSLAARIATQNEREYAGPLEGLAALALAQAQPIRAATLLGAAATIRVEDDLSPDGFDRRLDYTRTAQLAREQLGDDAFQAAYAAGQAMTLDDALAYARKPD